MGYKTHELALLTFLPHKHPRRRQHDFLYTFSRHIACDAQKLSDHQPEAASQHQEATQDGQAEKTNHS
jgi:hypothetical protein